MSSIRQQAAARIAVMLPAWRDLPPNEIIRFLMQRFRMDDLIEMEEDLRTMKRDAEENADSLGRTTHTLWHETMVGIRTAYFKHKKLRREQTAKAA